MPILSELSRRFHMLTTDATPDPPSVPIEGHTHNLQPTEKSKRKSKSTLSVEPCVDSSEHKGVTSRDKETTSPNDAIPSNADYSPKEDNLGDTVPSDEAHSKEQKKPSVKTKTKAKSRQYKQSQGANVISYNIINSNGVKIGSRTSYTCNVNQYAAGNSTSPESGHRSKSVPLEMTAAVESLSNSTDEVTLEDVFVIKTHVGHGWRDVARRLSYSDGQIEQFEENYRHRGVDEVIYQLLLDWKQNNTKDAEIGNLVRILWTCQEYDCAKRLVAAHKNPS